MEDDVQPLLRARRYREALERLLDLPFDALMVLGVGAAATSLSYVLLAAVRDWFEEAEGVPL